MFRKIEEVQKQEEEAKGRVEYIISPINSNRENDPNFTPGIESPAQNEIWVGSPDRIINDFNTPSLTYYEPVSPTVGGGVGGEETPDGVVEGATYFRMFDLLQQDLELGGAVVNWMDFQFAERIEKNAYWKVKGGNSNVIGWYLYCVAKSSGNCRWEFLDITKRNMQAKIQSKIKAEMAKKKSNPPTRMIAKFVKNVVDLPTRGKRLTLPSCWETLSDPAGNFLFLLLFIIVLFAAAFIFLEFYEFTRWGWLIGLLLFISGFGVFRKVRTQAAWKVQQDAQRTIQMQIEHNTQRLEMNVETLKEKNRALKAKREKINQNVTTLGTQIKKNQEKGKELHDSITRLNEEVEAVTKHKEELDRQREKSQVVLIAHNKIYDKLAQEVKKLEELHSEFERHIQRNPHYKWMNFKLYFRQQQETLKRLNEDLSSNVWLHISSLIDEYWDRSNQQGLTRKQFNAWCERIPPRYREYVGRLRWESISGDDNLMDLQELMAVVEDAKQNYTLKDSVHKTNWAPALFSTPLVQTNS